MAACWQYFVLLSVSVWCVADLCPDACSCTEHVATCQQCSYQLTFKQNSTNFDMPMCCNQSDQLLTLPHVNNTFLEIRANFDKHCNVSGVNLDLSLLNVISVVVKNTNFTVIKIKAKYPSELDLSSNKLKILSKGEFSEFPNLRKLNLSKNEISNISDGSFVGLHNLETLDLSRNNLSELSSALRSLKGLRRLNLSRNALRVLAARHFDNAVLSSLDVSHNALAVLAAGALQPLPGLARLLLGDNSRLGGAPLRLLGSGRRLQQLDAARAGLRVVPAAFSPAVRSLALPGNRIAAVRAGDLDTYPLLQALDLAANHLAAVDDDALGRLEMLVFLNLNRNNLTTIPRSLPDQLKYLSVNSNMVQNITRSDLRNLPNLKILLLQNNRIYHIEDHAFDDLLSLEMLDLSNNPLQSLSTSTFEGPLSLKDLRLCYLNLSLSEASGAGGGQDGVFPLWAAERVQLLHLAASPALAAALLRDSAALAALARLQYLDLRLNNLTRLRDDLLFYLVQLKTLRLHGNQFNCTAQLWLQDWMNGNKTSNDNETCYYSTSEAKPDIVKYNCSFPETFTINESLPPVNLYSTEMINKLLRYYGYLGNKTEKALKPANSNYYKNANSELKTTKGDVNKSVPDFYKTENYFQARKENKILIDSYFNETYNYKSKLSYKLMDQNKLQNDQQMVDRKFLGIEPYANLEEVSKMEEINRSRVNKSGIRLNTPIEHNRTAIPTQNLESSMRENYTTVSNERRESSAYQSTSSHLVPLMGLAWVVVMVVAALVAWGGVRLRTRRRAPPADADQIEVANISGSVLW